MESILMVSRARFIWIAINGGIVSTGWTSPGPDTLDLLVACACRIGDTLVHSAILCSQVPAVSYFWPFEPISANDASCNRKILNGKQSAQGEPLFTCIASNGLDFPQLVKEGKELVYEDCDRKRKRKNQVSYFASFAPVILHC